MLTHAVVRTPAEGVLSLTPMGAGCKSTEKALENLTQEELTTVFLIKADCV